MNTYRLTRFKFSLNASLGLLTMDGNDQLKWYTLEDVARERGVKIPGETAIPEGEYNIRIYDSPKYGKVPLLYNVENDNTKIEAQGKEFKFVEIHVGNFPKDTRGCILIGTSPGKNAVWQSRTAFNDFMDTWGDEGNIHKLIVTNNQE